MFGSASRHSAAVVGIPPYRAPLPAGGSSRWRIRGPRGRRPGARSRTGAAPGGRHAVTPDLPTKPRRWWDSDGSQEAYARFLGVHRRLLDRAGGTG